MGTSTTSTSSTNPSTSSSSQNHNCNINLLLKASSLLQAITAKTSSENPDPDIKSVLEKTELFGGIHFLVAVLLPMSMSGEKMCGLGEQRGVTVCVNILKTANNVKSLKDVLGGFGCNSNNDNNYEINSELFQLFHLLIFLLSQKDEGELLEEVVCF